MRVLFVSALPPERSSMVGRILPLAQEVRVAGRGHVVDILTLSGARRRPYVESREVEGVHIRTVGPALRATDDHHPNPVRALPRFLAGQAALTKALSTRKADVIILAKPQPQNTFPVLSWAEHTATPLVVDLDDRETEASRLPGPVRGAAGHLETQAVQQATAVTAATPALVEHAHALRPAARAEFLPTGIRIPATIPSARLRERLGLSPDAKIILYVGSLSMHSGHRVDALLEAFNELADAVPSAHLVLAGDGIDEQRLRAACSLPPVASRIHFLGRFAPPEDFALAHEANLLVDPVDRSLANEAKSSHRVLLALATGTPVVAGDVGVRPLFLPATLHKACLYDPDNPKALGAALAHGLHPTFRAQFRARTHGRIDQWTWPALGKQFVSLLESLIPSPTSRNSRL